MVTVLRKIFGVVALIWLGWVILNLLVCGVSFVATASGGAQRSAGPGDIAMTAAGMSLISYFAAFVGFHPA